MSNNIIYPKDIIEYSNLLNNYPCVIKFTARWCGPCQKINPKYEYLASTYGSLIKFLEIDIDRNRDISNQEDFKSIPFFLFSIANQRYTDLNMSGTDELILENNIKLLIEENKYLNSQNNQLLNMEVTYENSNIKYEENIELNKYEENTELKYNKEENIELNK